MTKTIETPRDTLIKAKLRLEVQLTMYDNPKFMEAVPLGKKTLAKINRNALAELINELNNLLKENGKNMEDTPET